MSMKSFAEPRGESIIIEAGIGKLKYYPHRVQNMARELIMA